MYFWISDWISGFHSGFLDFWISVWISADGVRDFFRDGPLAACERSTSEMDVDRATLAAAYRLGFSIFGRSTSRLSQSLLFTKAFLNSQSS